MDMFNEFEPELVSFTQDDWEWYRDKYGYVEGLEEYFKDTAMKDSQIQGAITQLKSAEAFLDKRMEELAGTEWVK